MMGNPMLHGHGAHGPGSAGSMMPLFLPVPMAVFGVAVAFMFGATLGMRMGEKRSMMAGRGACGPWMGGMGGRDPMMSAMAHHHHGNGAPCCCEQPDPE
jgi:hypothetical protein